MTYYGPLSDLPYDSIKKSCTLMRLNSKVSQYQTLLRIYIRTYTILVLNQLIEK